MHRAITTCLPGARIGLAVALGLMIALAASGAMTLSSQEAPTTVAHAGSPRVLCSVTRLSGRCTLLSPATVQHAVVRWGPDQSLR